MRHDRAHIAARGPTEQACLSRQRWMDAARCSGCGVGSGQGASEEGEAAEKSCVDEGIGLLQIWHERTDDRGSCSGRRGILAPMSSASANPGAIRLAQARSAEGEDESTTRL